MDDNKALAITKDISVSVADAICEEGADHVSEIASFVSGLAFDGAALTVADGILGALVPGAYAAVQGYKTRRTERNIRTALLELRGSMDEINARLEALEEKDRCKYSGGYRDAYLDTIVDENQEEKVRCCTWAFVNSMGVSESNEDMFFTLFGDLADLNMLDIRTLRLYKPVYLEDDSGGDDSITLMREEGIDDAQYRFVREKLARFGLLGRKNDLKREKNQASLQETVIELVKQQAAKKPKAVKLPKFERVSSSDSYKITSLGCKYLQMLEQPSGSARE